MPWQCVDVCISPPSMKSMPLSTRKLNILSGFAHIIVGSGFINDKLLCISHSDDRSRIELDFPICLALSINSCINAIE